MKFNTLYNLIMENMVKSLSDEQMKELKDETNEFLHTIKTNAELADTNLIPAETDKQNELTDEISDLLLFGTNNNIKESFLHIIEPLDLNLSEFMIDNILRAANKNDYKKLILFLNDRNTLGMELGADTISLTDISNKTGLSEIFLKQVSGIERKKEWC